MNKEKDTSNLQHFLSTRRVGYRDANLAILGGCYTTSHYFLTSEEYAQFCQYYLELGVGRFSFHQISSKQTRLFLDLDQDMRFSEVEKLACYLQDKYNTPTFITQKYSKGEWLPRYHIITHYVTDKAREILGDIMEERSLAIDVFPGMNYHLRILGSIKKLNQSDRSFYLPVGKTSFDFQDLLNTSIYASEDVSLAYNE